MLFKAKVAGFSPEYILSDSRYSGLKNLKIIDSYGWHRLTRLKLNRLINPDNTENIPLSSADISETGSAVHLKGCGFVRIFGIAGEKGRTEYQAADNLDMDEFERIRLSDFSRTIEECHRGL
ncbi:hypothetical protein QUF75_20700 [Desulfococcaceae bacterium HSG7]|nr:hypothetical protein [Desulfococcaceae bacterium HSG7]